ncbi:MAG: hypothetical protein KDD94_01005 [Calditrichaeota bacterium]|nr:hypothetical protein [Calditrichota bacterium]
MYWLLFCGWVLGAALFMARVNGGFFTNWLSDLTFPAWFYIHIRGLETSDRRKARLLIVGDWFGRSPERALVSIFLVGIVSEVMTYFWPTGIIHGRFDLLDILAYVVGLIVCYYFDKKNEY